MDLKKWIKWFVYSNIWVSINVVSFYIFVALVSKMPIDKAYASLLFFATLFAYNFQRFLKTKQTKTHQHRSERHVWISEHQSQIVVLTVLGAIVSGVLAFMILPWFLILLSIPALIIVLFYTRRDESSSALRNIPLAKIFLISAVWVFVVLFIPQLLLDVRLDGAVFTLALPLALFVGVLCIPFDIRDRKVDQGRLKTLPVVLGSKVSMYIAVSTMVFISIWSYMNNAYAFPLSAIVIIPSLIYSTEERSELYFAGWIEGQFTTLLLLQILVEVI